MNKQAILDEVRHAAFEDELEKAAWGRAATAVAGGAALLAGGATLAGMKRHGGAKGFIRHQAKKEREFYFGSKAPRGFVERAAS